MESTRSVTARSERAFTLIELLVVISIISLLSSVVLASLNAARDKARLAAARQFASHTERVAGEQAVGIWDFDECSGATAGDRSGFGYDLSAFNGASSSPETPFGSGCSLQFDGVNDYLAVASGLGPDISEDYTISLWFRTSVALADIAFAGRWNAGGGYLLYVTSATPGFRIYANSSFVRTTENPTYSDGRWHHLVGSKIGSAGYIYLDGVRLPDTGASLPASITTATNNVAFRIADYNVGGNAQFSGNIDDVRLFAKGLTASEVGKLYAESSPKHRLADAKKSD